MKYPAPALHKGIVLLDLLNRIGELSLDALASQTGFSKASILRLMETFEGHGWVGRDASSKAFQSRVLVKDRSPQGWLSESQLQSELDRLASETHCTVEWYVKGKRGMEIQLRSEPEECAVKVLAKLGFVRSFNGELDAVNRIAASQDLFKLKGSVWTSYAKTGKQSINHKEAQALVRESKASGISQDQEWNENGIRRYAVRVCRPDGTLAGIAAIAESFTPRAEQRTKFLLDRIRSFQSQLEQKGIS